MKEDSGYNVAELPGEPFVADLRKSHGIGQMASLKDIEPVARKLLITPGGFFRAAALILNRRVDAKEEIIAYILRFVNPDTRYALLLMQHQQEKSAKQKSL